MKSSNDKNAPEDSLLIGEIAGVHGLRGALKLRSYADSPALFESGLRLGMEHPDGGVETCALAWSKPHGKGLLLALEGVTDRAAAEALVGCRLWIPRSALPELAEDTYYWFELIGLSVYTTRDRYLGRLEAIVPTGSNDVYVVRNGEDEVLVPALSSVVVSIDRDQGRMEVTLPDGL